VDQDGKPVKVLFDGDEPMQDDYYNYIPDESGRYISVKSDGTPYTAADVGIKAEGRKLTITLDKPMPQLLSLLTLASAMPYRPQTEDKSVNTLVNGPWKIGQWVEGKSISLVRNEEYRMKTDITDIECVPVTREAAIGLVKSGDLDLAVLPRGTSVQMDFDWIQTGRQVDGTVLYLQLKQSAVGDQSIRQQLSGALDREELSATVAGYPATGVIPDNVYSFENSLRAGVTEYPLLVPGNQGVSEVDLELILAINNGSAEESDMADAIQRELLDALGVTVMIESASFGDINHMLDEGRCNAVFGSVGPYMSADEYLNAFTDGAAETGNYSVREQQIISDALYIPLTFGTFDYAYHSKLSGVAFRHDGVVTLTEAKLS
jgi:ABC-type transport system substrate-binding protein